MNKNKSIALILLSAFLLAGLAACRKNQNAPTLFSNLLGKWKKTQYATDDNNDGIIEASEIHNVPSGTSDVLQFNSNASGVETNVTDDSDQSPPLAFNWKVISTDSLWVGYDANDTLTYYVAEINASNLQLNTEISSGLVAYFYAKQ